jgi:hypothetical protein
MADRRHDGEAIPLSGGHTLVVFNPPWWRLDRWTIWLLTPKEEKDIVNLVVEGGVRRLRVFHPVPLKKW